MQISLRTNNGNRGPVVIARKRAQARVANYKPQCRPLKGGSQSTANKGTKPVKSFFKEECRLQYGHKAALEKICNWLAGAGAKVKTGLRRKIQRLLGGTVSVTRVAWENVEDERWLLLTLTSSIGASKFQGILAKLQAGVEGLVLPLRTEKKVCPTTVYRTGRSRTHCNSSPSQTQSPSPKGNVFKFRAVVQPVHKLFLPALVEVKIRCPEMHIVCRNHKVRWEENKKRGWVTVTVMTAGVPSTRVRLPLADIVTRVRELCA